VSLPPKEPKRFSEAEVAAILRRSAALQARRITAEASSGPDAGISLEQLQRAAGELGVPAELLAAAAAEIEGEGRPSLWGGPSTAVFERVVDAAVTADEWPELVAAIRRQSGRVGEPGQLGKAFEWMSAAPDPLHVIVTPRRDGTHLRVSARYSEWGFLVYMGAFTGSLMGALALIGALHYPVPLELAAAAGWTGFLFAGARAAFSRVCRGRRAATEVVMNAMVSHLEQQEAEAAQESLVSPVGTQGVEPALLGLKRE
jgi:hypothetical protein